MPRRFPPFPHAAAAVVLGVLAAVCAAVPSYGATLTQTFSCTYPLTDAQSVTVDFAAEEPNWTPGAPVAPIDITAKVRLDGVSDGLDVIDASTLEVSGTATGRVVTGDTTVPITVPLAFPSVSVPGPLDPVLLEGGGATPSITVATDSFRLLIDGIALNVRVKDADGSAIVLPPVTPVDSDGDPETFDVPCNLDPAGQDRQLLPDATTGDTPPTPPGVPVVTDIGVASAKVTWDASTDDKGVVEYEVRYGPSASAISTLRVSGATSATLSGLLPDTAYLVAVRARDTAGQWSEASTPTQFTTRGGDPVPPTAPGNLRVTDRTGDAVTLAWSASTDDVGVVGYEVFQDGAKVKDVAETSATIDGVPIGQPVTFKVRAIDQQGLPSPFSDEVTIPADVSDPLQFALKGSSQLRTLTTGPVPVTGGITAALDLTTGAYTGDLTLNATRANLRVLGLVPVKADIGFEVTDKVRGTLSGGVLTATAKFKIRLKQLYLFGVLPIAGDGQCRTKSSSIANLRSTDAVFDPIAGGRLAGSYGISDLEGCGLLTDFISPLAKGGGNTLDLQLTPQF